MNTNNIQSLHTLFFHNTSYCNLKCRHCWITPTYASDGRCIKKEVSLSTLKSLVDKALPLGLRNIKITGGEPFLRRDILDFIEYFSSQKLSVSIETNGTLLEEDTAKALKRLNVGMVAVSLDGKSPDTHDYIRGVHGAYERAMNGIELLRKFKVPFEIVTVLHQGNLHEIEDLFKLSDTLGARIHKINPVAAMGRGQKMNLSGELLSVREIISLNRTIEDSWQRKFKTKIELDIPVAFKSIAFTQKTGFCKCGIKNMLGVLANGKLALCGIGENVDELTFGYADKCDITEIWSQNRILCQIRTQIPGQLEGICQRCLMKHYCLGRCRANAYYSTGSLTGPFAFCEEAYKAGLFPATRFY